MSSPGSGSASARTLASPARWRPGHGSASPSGRPPPGVVHRAHWAGGVLVGGPRRVGGLPFLGWGSNGKDGKQSFWGDVETNPHYRRGRAFSPRESMLMSASASDQAATNPTLQKTLSEEITSVSINMQGLSFWKARLPFNVSSSKSTREQVLTRSIKTFSRGSSHTVGCPAGLCGSEIKCLWSR